MEYAGDVSAETMQERHAVFPISYIFYDASYMMYDISFSVKHPEEKGKKATLSKKIFI